MKHQRWYHAVIWYNMSSDEDFRPMEGATDSYVVAENLVEATKKVTYLLDEHAVNFDITEIPNEDVPEYFKLRRED